jgi:hypothetical protein
LIISKSFFRNFDLKGLTEVLLFQTMASIIVKVRIFIED